MKLALCVFKYFPYGGLQRNFLAVARELVQRGHEVTIYTGLWEGDFPEGLTVVLIPVSGLSNHARNRHFHSQLQQRLDARKEQQDGVDLVVGFNKMPGLDVYYCADTCFASKAYEDKGLLYRLMPRSRWSLAFERAVFEAASPTEILLLSAAEGEAYQQYYGTGKERLHLMPPGISKTRVRHAGSTVIGQSVRRDLNIGEGDKLIAFLGSDYKRKGLDRLLLCIAALPGQQRKQTKVVVIGRDKRMAKYQRMASGLNIAENIIFVGQRDDVPAVLFACDLLVHPAYLENTGNAILEAVVAGLPVLCTAKCGYAFYIEENQLGQVIPEPFEQGAMNTLFKNLLDDFSAPRERCLSFAQTADIYSRPQRISETIERIGENKCR